jgi:hypothetical protein
LCKKENDNDGAGCSNWSAPVKNVETVAKLTEQAQDESQVAPHLEQENRPLFPDVTIRMELIEGCQLTFALKRIHAELDDDSEVPSKILRSSQLATK